MSLIPIRIFNPENIHENIIWGFLFYAISKGIDVLIKNRNKITRKDLRRTYRWFKMGYHFILAITFSYLGRLFHAIHLYGIEGKFSDRVVNEAWLGFMTFFRTFPRAGWKIMKVFKVGWEQMQINEITGVKTDLHSLIKKTVEEEDEVEKNLISELEKNWA